MSIASDSPGQAHIGSLPAAAIAIDTAGTIRWCTEEAAALLSRPSAAIVGRRCYDVLRGQSPSGERLCDRACPILVSLADGRGAAPIDVVLPDTPSPEVPSSPLRIELHSVALLDEAGQPALLVHLMEDVTVRRLRERIGTRFLSLVHGEVGHADFLTPREDEVVRLLAAGMSARQIAASLGISHGTARNHIHRVLQKLGAPTRVAAVMRWLELESDTSPPASIPAHARPYDLLRTLVVDIAGSPDTTTALGLVLERLCEHTGWDYGEAWLPDEPAGELRLSPAWYTRRRSADDRRELAAFRQLSEGLAWRRGAGIPGRVWASATHEWVADIAGRPDIPRTEIAGRIGLRSSLAAPILARGRVVAIIQFFAASARPEDERLLELVSAVTAELGVLVGQKAAEQALRESEARYRALVNQAHDVVCVVTRAGTIAYASPASERVYGYSLEELRGRSWLDLVHPEDRAQVEAGLASTMAAGGPATLVARFRHRDGTWHWLEAAGSDQSGNPAVAGILLSLRDITELVQANAALRESERRHHDLIEQAADAILVADAGGRLVDVNAAACALVGRACDALLGEMLGTVIGDGAAALCVKRARGQPGEAISGSWAIRRADGAVVETEVSVRVLTDGRCQAILRDVTERKRAEEGRARLAAVVEQTADAVLLTDPAGTIVYVNAAFELVSGYARDELLGGNPRLLKSGQHDEAFYRQMWQTLADGRSWSGLVVNRRKDGTLFEKESVITPVRDDAMTLAGYVELSRDVTRERELEEQLRQVQKVEAIGRLAGGVAHDFNNLLTAIRGYAQLVLGDLPPDAPHRSDLEAIDAAGARGADLTRQLLAFGRRQVMQPEVLDVNVAVEEVAPLLRRLLGEDVTLRTVLSPVGRTRVDPGQLHQVIVNLAVNARDAMPQGGTLTIATEEAVLDETYRQLRPVVRAGRYVLVSVTDTGAGMEPEVLARIFEPFFTTKPRGQGTGLGLATVYGIVRQSGGHIWAYSEPGHGTTFKIYLPRIDAPASRRRRAATGAEVRGGTETVLLAEDEEAVRRLARTVLERAGYTVLAAGGAEEATRIAAEHGGAIDLLLTDVVMPGRSGRQLAEALAAQRPGLRVLYVSGYAAETITDRGILEPGVHFLAKPFTRTDLLRRVRELLDAPPPGPAGMAPG